ncbi:mitochondrial fission ELM1 family protein, partial [Candidatus Pelagibacter sp.]|nr:mitochondrial fission ELM1 family protein [Candidatus Pelagibacter sp.]
MAKLKGILLTEGMHGMISQVEGLAKALDIEFTHHKVELNHFWKFIPPNLSPISQSVFQKINHDDFDVIISCGRKSVIPSIHLKKTANKKVFNIHIQDPKVDLNNFDFIVAPEHDAIQGPNVISTKGAIHYLTENEISENKDYLNSFIKRDERKIWTLILGGPTKYYDYSTKNMKHIFTSLYKLLKKHDFQLVVIPSMRTPINTIHYAREFFGESHTIIMDVDKKAYLSALALSQNIIVTCDSSSMISEAALTGKPIYIASILPKKNDKRFQSFR